MIIKKILPTVMAGLLITACSGERPRYNAASLESEPLVPEVASLDTALTFGQIPGEDGLAETLLVLGMTPDTIQAVNLSVLGAARGVDVFDAIKSLDEAVIQAAANNEELYETYAIEDLMPAAGDADRHVASGTNFPEHAEEANYDSVFNFPKFGKASPARTVVEYRPDVLLDYEVEICVRFDRDIKTVEDFDAAVKGFFLCGDFTDRAQLIRLVDTDNFDSGSGFSDSKSRFDFFPTGPFVVIPNDWLSFVKEERITTHVDGQIRQDARGGEMTMNFRELTKKVLGDVTSTRFQYRGENVLLVEDKMIPKGATLMSGTAEGVIFMPPTSGDITTGILNHIFTGKFLGDQSGRDTVIERFIQKEMETKRYLQVGEVVSYASSRMGTVRIMVVDPK